MSKEEKKTAQNAFKSEAGVSNKVDTIIVDLGADQTYMIKSKEGRGGMGPNPNGPAGDWTWHFPGKN
jgi:hypothetical protein